MYIENTSKRGFSENREEITVMYERSSNIVRFIKQKAPNKNTDVNEENLLLYYYFPDYFREIGSLEFFYYDNLIPRGIWLHLKWSGIDYLHQLKDIKLSRLLQIRTFGPKYITPLLELCKTFNINIIDDIKCA